MSIHESAPTIEFEITTTEILVLLMAAENPTCHFTTPEQDAIKSIKEKLYVCLDVRLHEQVTLVTAYDGLNYSKLLLQVTGRIRTPKKG
jgi:hypothetical protein